MVGIHERSGQPGIFTFVREDAISGTGLPVGWALEAVAGGGGPPRVTN